MTKTRRSLAIVIGLILGGFATYFGANELSNSIRLEKRGVPTTAEVVDGRERVSGRFRRRSYYLTIAFQDGKGAVVRKEVKVTKETYGSGHASGSTKAFYLPEDSSICAAGETLDLRYGNLLLGLVLLGGAGVFVVTVNQSGKVGA